MVNIDLIENNTYLGLFLAFFAILGLFLSALFFDFVLFDNEVGQTVRNAAQFTWGRRRALCYPCWRVNIYLYTRMPGKSRKWRIFSPATWSPGWRTPDRGRIFWCRHLESPAILSRHATRWQWNARSPRQCGSERPVQCRKIWLGLNIGAV